MKKIFGYGMLACSVVSLFVLSTAVAQDSPKLSDERYQWWQEARFGMFIHWGTYAMAARHEWVKSREHLSNEAYQKYFDHFDPDLYNPREWARTAKQAGMRYFVITTKHHEGFCLWDSQFTDYKAPNTPYGKDLLKPMVDAFRAEGLHVGFYYSLIDWHHPDYTIDRHHPMRANRKIRKTNSTRDMSRYVDYVENQLRELLTQFGPIDSLFLDFSFPGKDGKGHDDWQSERLLKLVRQLQPQCLINDRLDLLDKPEGWDFRTPEQYIPRSWVSMDGLHVPWETCQTFSGSWGYYRDEDTWKSPTQLVTMLIETVSKGGNLLLNVGPTARGTFDDRAMERLAAIGDWMKLHNRAIYGCTAAPAEFKKPDNCLLTYNPKTNRLYVHVLAWPSDKLHLDGFQNKVAYAQLLNDASEVNFNNEKGEATNGQKDEVIGICTKLPVRQPNVLVPVIELFLK